MTLMNNVSHSNLIDSHNGQTEKHIIEKFTNKPTAQAEVF